MFFVSQEVFDTVTVVGGTSRLESAMTLAEKRSRCKLDWVITEKGYRAEQDCGDYRIVYTIDEGEH